MAFKKKDTKVIVTEKWCKKCGICIAFCPEKVLGSEEDGRAIVIAQDKCIVCKKCEYLCPEFAINIEVELDEQKNVNARK